MVYLLHFSRAYGHARHYLGTVPDGSKPGAIVLDVSDRSKHGYLAAVFADGITFEIARTWPGGVERMRTLQRQASASRFCPICRDLAQGAAS